MNKLILTFDIEDFINTNAIKANLIILKLLKKYDLKGIFFITGHQAENFVTQTELLELLQHHEIGYHSSSHSVRPIIQEFTDVKNYSEARNISLKRETSHINPLTGQINGEGGIYSLKKIFPKKLIESFRAPGMSWTPPHLEALSDLGIKFDFSSNISYSEPKKFKKITFYPYTFLQSWNGTITDYQYLHNAILRKKISVFDIHPSQMVNRVEWDQIYYKSNPESLTKIEELVDYQSNIIFNKFEKFLKILSLYKKIGVIDVNTNLNEFQKNLITSKNEVDDYYNNSIKWPRNYFSYVPKNIYEHFKLYFQDAMQ